MPNNPQGSSATSAQLDQILRDAIEEHEPVPDTGVAVAVIQNHNLLFSEGYGKRDREAGLDVSAQTTFGIGSVTKPFTALAWAIHEEAGGQNINDPIVNHQPSFAVKDGSVTPQMSVRDLLSQQTGLPRHDVLWYLGGFDRPDLVRRLQYLDPDPLADYRQKGKYNNLMYTAAGWVLEESSGSPWSDFVQTHILDPLDMNDTSFTVDALKQATEYAAPYLLDTRMDEPKDVTNIAPAGAINSTVLDMAKWLELYLNGGKSSSGDVILSDQKTQKQLDPVVPMEWRGKSIHYGLGWFISEHDGHTITFHTGSTDGYSAIAVLVPDEDLGVCILTNQHSTLLPDRLAEVVVNFLLGQSATDDGWKAAMASEAEPFFSVLPPSPLAPPASPPVADTYSGRYKDDGYGEIKIERDSVGRWLSWADYRWRLWRLPPWFLPWFAFRVAGYGRKQIVPIWIRRESQGGRSFAIPFEPEVDTIRFFRS
jgi:CubicO group peptidase (beta-lactamase class C family)